MLDVDVSSLGATLGGILRKTEAVLEAEQPGAVRIKNTGTLDYYDHFLFLESTKYVKVDGFIFDHSNSQYPPYTASIPGTFNKATRNIVRRSGPTEQYGGWWYVSGTDNLLEDCAGVGSARYGFSVGGPSDFSQRIIIRRCVGRVDYSISSEPKATFNVYGNEAEAERTLGPASMEIVVDAHFWLPVTIRTEERPAGGKPWNFEWTAGWKFGQKFSEDDLAFSPKKAKA